MCTTADTITSSPLVRKRGVTRRTIRFLRTVTLRTAPPTWVSRVTPRAVARQVVKESGKSRFAVARPSGPVVRWATQSAVSGNALRTRGSASVCGLSAASADPGRSEVSRIAFFPEAPWK